MVIDGAGLKFTEVFKEEIRFGNDEVKAVLITNGVEPHAEVRYSYRSMPQLDFKLLRSLDLQDAKSLGKALISAVEAAEKYVKKAKEARKIR